MDFIFILFYFLIIIPSAIIHEYAHGWMADRLGDPTARHMGRLTLNPIAHIDLFGTILLPLFLFFMTAGGFLFAYAKPVPYNPFNLSNIKRDPALVGAAGPLSNLILAFIFSMFIRFIPLQEGFIMFFSIIVYANILLAVFNLIPIPPLDGSKILFALLPDSAWGLRQTLEQYGFIILLFFIFFLADVLGPIINILFKLFTGFSFLS